jgi:hypothetical protein
MDTPCKQMVDGKLRNGRAKSENLRGSLVNGRFLVLKL